MVVVLVRATHGVLGDVYAALALEEQLVVCEHRLKERMAGTHIYIEREQAELAESVGERREDTEGWGTCKRAFVRSRLCATLWNCCLGDTHYVNDRMRHGPSHS